MNAPYHYVYEFYAQDGSCLYVGYSIRIDERIYQHSIGSPWFSEVAKIEIVVHKDYRTGLDAEKARIRALGPAYNVAFNKTHTSVGSEP